MSHSGVHPAIPLQSGLPLCVDLDGSLIRTDLLWESLVLLLTRQPWLLLMPFLWVLGGRARLKAELARRVDIAPALLPYDERVLAFLREQHSLGRRLILATAANHRFAGQAAKHLGIFDEVIAADDSRNLTGGSKAAKLEAEFGRFSYLGNDSHDLAVWRKAETALVANASPRLIRRLRQAVPQVEAVFPQVVSRLGALIKAIRPHQWSKNLLVVVPIITSNQIFDLRAWLMVAVGGAAFCATASGDLFAQTICSDLVADRAHPRKRTRPFASGSLPLAYGVCAAPVLLAAGLLLAAQIKILPIILLYASVSVAYTCWLKTRPLVDVFTLAISLFHPAICRRPCQWTPGLTVAAGLFGVLLFGPRRHEARD